MSTTVTRVIRATWRQDFITVAFGLWLIGGLFLDGWAHNNKSNLETFFTPWHAVFYSGFTATAAWVVHASGFRFTARSRKDVAEGYDLALVGLVIFAVAGVCDGIWHTLLGIEKDIPALLSPPHLALLLGGLLILSAPLRSCWQSQSSIEQSSLVRFLPPLLSVVLSAALFSFFFQYAAAFVDDRPTDSFHRYMLSHHPGDNDYRDVNYSLGVLAIFVSNVVLVGPLCLMLRRWRTPFGAVTVLFGLIGLVTSAILTFTQWTSVIAAVIGGLVADAMIRRRAYRYGSRRQLQLVVCVATVAMWSTHFLLLSLVKGVWWPATMYGGTIVMATFVSYGLALLSMPPTVPAGVIENHAADGVSA